jgi:hypothetical protein
MRIMTYKRTHIGDPDPSGRFGISNCMGRVRSYDYDAVVGVGGIGAEPVNCGIARKVNWVGVGPQRGANGVVSFEHFGLFEGRGPLFAELAPSLARRMYGKNVRFLIDSYTSTQRQEVESILEWSRTPQAQGTNAKYRPSHSADCRSRCAPKKAKGQS